MDTALKIERKDVYGNSTYYPRSENAMIVATMLGQKTLTARNLTYLAQMGFSIQRVVDGVVIRDMVTAQQVKENLLRQR